MGELMVARLNHQVYSTWSFHKATCCGDDQKWIAANSNNSCKQKQSKCELPVQSPLVSAVVLSGELRYMNDFRAGG